LRAGERLARLGGWRVALPRCKCRRKGYLRLMGPSLCRLLLGAHPPLRAGERLARLGGGRVSLPRCK